jgi:hypothetical protein
LPKHCHDLGVVSGAGTWSLPPWEAYFLHQRVGLLLVALGKLRLDLLPLLL